MGDEPLLTFGPFQLDISNACLWKAGERQRLTPKAFAVLYYFVHHAGRLVSKEEVFEAVWADTVVSDAALTKCVKEVRQVLGDDAKAPQYIETLHRRGYRFIAPLTTTTPPVPSSRFPVPGSQLFPAPSTQHRVPHVVGRDAELKQLRGWLAKAVNGHRQL